MILDFAKFAVSSCKQTCIVLSKFALLNLQWFKDSKNEGHAKFKGFTVVSVDSSQCRLAYTMQPSRYTVHTWCSTFIMH